MEFAEANLATLIAAQPPRALVSARGAQVPR